MKITMMCTCGGKWSGTVNESACDCIEKIYRDCHNGYNCHVTVKKGHIANKEKK